MKSLYYHHTYFGKKMESLRVLRAIAPPGGLTASFWWITLFAARGYNLIIIKLIPAK